MMGKWAKRLVAAAALAPALANANPYNLPQPESIVAHEIYDLHTLIFVICCVIFVVVFGAMFYAIIMHRKAAGHNAKQFHESTTVEIVWTIVPFLILIGMAYPATKTVLAMNDTPRPDLTNFGELMDAMPLPDARLRLIDGVPFQLSQLRGKWVLLMADTARCDEACQRTLFTLRQLRLTQGRDMERIERAWLISDDAALSDALRSDYHGTWLVRAAASELLKRLPAAHPRTEYIYIIDPLGNLVLRYGRDAEPGKMIKDLTRLLKTSRIG